MKLRIRFNCRNNIKLLIMKELENKKIAIITEIGFEESELIVPKEEFEKAGAKVTVISPNPDKKLKGWKDGNWGKSVEVDKKPTEVKVTDFDALIIPGGVMNPDKLRRDDASIEFVKDFIKSGKPVAAICHGPQMLIETNLLEGRTLTSHSCISTDLKNAGAKWMDKEVQKDDNIITSRKVADIPAFIQAIFDALK